MKTLTLPVGKTEYTLEFTRKTVEQMERAGFNREDLVSKPMTTLPALFAGAFKANHPKVSHAVIDDIFEHLAGKTELVGKLIDMYMEPFETMMTDDEDEGKNIKWTANW